MNELYQNTYQYGDSAPGHDKPGWPSGRPMIEPAGPVGSLAVASGSLPAFDAEGFCAWLAEKVGEYKRREEANAEINDYESAIRYRHFATMTERVRLHLRHLLAVEKLRQPER